MDDLRLVLQGLWFRRWVSLAVLVVASLVVGAAVTGPLFLRAAQESVLRDTLEAALAAGRGVNEHSNPKETLGDRPLERVQAQDAVKLAGRLTLSRLVGPPVASLEVGAAAGSPGQTTAPVDLAWQDGACAHVRMVSGTCAEQPGTVMVSESTSTIEAWRLGRPLLVNGRRLSISGTYVPLDPNGDYWAGRPYFAAFSGGDSTLDAVFGPRSTVEDQDGDAGASARVDRQLDLHRIRVADVPDLQRDLATWSDLDDSGVFGDTAAPVVLDQATMVVGDLVLPVTVVEAQLLVLCWLVLFLVVANAAEARGPEIALAKLRGVPVRTTVALGVLDTVLLVVLAVALGFGLAWAWTVGLTRGNLAPDVPVVLTSGAFAAAGCAGAGAAVAAVLASASTLRRPVVDQWRRATRRVRARSWLVDATVAAVAVGGLVALLGRGPVRASTPPALALIAPSLVILVAALVGSRALPALCRAAFEPTRRRGWVAGLLSVRQLGRRPSTLRLALLLTVAFGLVVFGVDAWSVARSNAHDRAWTEVGAAQVLTVNVPPGVDLGDVVDRIDPSGGQVVAVSTASDFTRLPSVLLMGVQPDRFARVAFWRDDLGPAPLAGLTSRLTVPSAPPVMLSGDRVRIDVDVAASTARAAPVLVADVVQRSALGGASPVVLGPLRPGRHRLETVLPCAATCRLSGLTLQRSGAAFYPYRATVALIGLQVHRSAEWQDRSSAVTTPAGWRPLTPGATSAVSGRDGTVLQVDAARTDSPGWQVADHPAALPALVGVEVSDAGRTLSAGLGTRALLPLDPVGVVAAVPGAAGRGVVVDRSYALRASEGSVARDVETVWLRPGAVASAPQLLEKAGVTVLSTTSADDLAAVYARQGPGLALLLFLAGASLAALLAGGGAALTLHLNGRRRTYELAAMLALGVRKRTLLASLYLEQGLLVMFGMVVGTATGLLAATVALPLIPEFSDCPTAPPLLYDVHGGPVVGAVLGATLVLGVAVVISSTSLVRSADVDQLREAPA